MSFPNTIRQLSSIRQRFLLSIGCLAFLLSMLSVSSTMANTDWNRVILEELVQMPSGGGYAVTSQAKSALQKATRLSANRLSIQPKIAQPSFCSGATYLVLLRVLQRLNLTPETNAALLVGHEVDGVGLWGRWNANGPGVARLFHELQAGMNFSDLSQARPGDFLKIFWSKEIGRNERGHLVIFLGLEERDGESYIRFWSSNQPGGYGEKSVPLRKVGRLLFSRLDRPENFTKATLLPKKDKYLAGLLEHRSTEAEMRQMCGY